MCSLHSGRSSNSHSSDSYKYVFQGEEVRIKKGVRTNGTKVEILIGVMVAENIWKAHDKELVITEFTGGTHGRGSLHYVGLAADLRTGYFSDSQKHEVAEQLRAALSEEYDVVVEKSHIHLEYNPK